MNTPKPLAASAIAGLFAAVEKDEQLQLCDEQARGDRSAAEVDAALGKTSPRMERIRRMSEPLTGEQKAQLVAQLLQPALAQPAIPRKPWAQRARVLEAYGAGLALAASLAIYVGWPRAGEQLPVLALEVAAHQSVVLAAPTSAGPAGLKVPLRSCLELRLRPERSYGTRLQTAVWLVPEGTGAAPVPWPVQLQQTEKGMLQLEPCEPLPGAVGPGSWQLAVIYGRKLPAADAVKDVLAAPVGETKAAPFQFVRQPLQVMVTLP